ncbi:unnamed protein product [Adineta ricciae]|uniref:Uncharacterized protein n=1 Tax=Adineta ricciae TaxID=249248 RepID=A0A816F2J5_ADIRI|nr:unnamed protein product [Adineta ricciae]
MLSVLLLLEMLGCPPLAVGIGQASTIVRSDGYLNTSHVTVSLPSLYKKINIQYVHVVQMSDFDSSLMSSIPLQFLFNGFANHGGCTTPPAIIGSRPNRACIVIGSRKRY